MTHFVALLRGINVGGHRKMPMADLRKLHEKMGHTNVKSYLQSGNLMFDCLDTERAILAETLEQAYEARFGFNTQVIVRKALDIVQVAQKCPIELAPDREAKFLHLVFLSNQPTAKAIAILMQYDGPEELMVLGDVLYIYYTNGAGRAKLSLSLIEKRLNVMGTARNWNTVTKLIQLTADDGAG